MVPVYGAYDKLQVTLESLYEQFGQDPSVNVIIVDDHHPEPLRLKLPEDFKVRLYRMPQNSGFAAACNKGASLGSAPYVVFHNSDVAMFPGWLHAMLGTFTNPQVGVVGAKLLFPPTERQDPLRPGDRVQHAGISFNTNNLPYHPFIGWSSENPKVNRPLMLQAVTGALLGIRRPLFEAIGGFNTIYGKGTYEDIELCIEARLRGYRVVYNPTVSGYHYTGGSGGGFPVNYNAQVFLDRYREKIIWDEWAVY